MAKKVKEEAGEEPKTPKVETNVEKSEKQKLLELYQTLKDLNVRSISDLEGLIARAE